MVVLVAALNQVLLNEEPELSVTLIPAHTGFVPAEATGAAGLGLTEMDTVKLLLQPFTSTPVTSILVAVTGDTEMLVAVLPLLQV